MQSAVLLLVALAATVSALTLDKNGIVRVENPDTSAFSAAAYAARRDVRNPCFSFRKANTGWLFKAARADIPDERKVCVAPCKRGDCYQITGPCTPECPNCVRSFACTDTEDKKRCFDLKPCACTNGDFQCIPSNVGVKFHKASPAEAGSAFSNRGDYFLFERYACENENTFHMLPCNPATSLCNSIGPCESDTMECCQLVPSEDNSASTSTVEPTSNVPTEAVTEI